MRDIGVGIIGTGFMGKAHAFAYRAVSGIFPVALRPVLRMVADNNRDAGLAAQKQLGFETFTADWTELVRDPGLEIVSITTPNVVHREMALAAIAARQACPLREADRAQRRRRARHDGGGGGEGRQDPGRLQLHQESRCSFWRAT